MRKPAHFLSVAAFTAVTLLSVSGCAVRGRYYDTRYSDYHRWGPGEAGPYSRWEVEMHRPHTDYHHLSHADQQSYWEWRHDHR
ncbi:MAG TPA: hypothetical protein VHC90_24165 [Bryobacteraceae bacterium]|nr:hypothetical protein [Bryobacteraceae bacterium]